MNFKRLAIQKHIKIVWLGIFLFGALVFQSCASFPDLPKNVRPSSEIIGIYSNDCDSASNGWKGAKLWRLIDPESEFTFKEDSTMVMGLTGDNRPTIEYVKVNQDSFFVRIEITAENQLKAQLIQANQVVSEKIIEGDFEDDQSYTSRSFFIVPFFPVFWGWADDRDRIYAIEDFLVFESAYNGGGGLLIMAAGSSGTYKWLFRKIQ